MGEEASRAWAATQPSLARVAEILTRPKGIRDPEEMLADFHSLLASVTDPGSVASSHSSVSSGHSEGEANPRADSAATPPHSTTSPHAPDASSTKDIVPHITAPVYAQHALGVEGGDGGDADDVEQQQPQALSQTFQAVLAAVTGGVQITPDGFTGRFNKGFFAVNAARHGLSVQRLAAQLQTLLGTAPPAHGGDSALHGMAEALSSAMGVLPLRLLASSSPALRSLSKAWLSGVQSGLALAGSTLAAPSPNVTSELAFDGVHLTLPGLARACLAFWADDLADAPLPNYPKVLSVPAEESPAEPSTPTEWDEDDAGSDDGMPMADAARYATGVRLSTLLSRFPHLPALFRATSTCERTLLATWLATTAGGLDAVPPTILQDMHRGYLNGLSQPSITFFFVHDLPGATVVCANERMHTVMGLTPFMLRSCLRLGTKDGLAASASSPTPALWVHPSSRLHRSVAHSSAANLGMDAFTFEGLFLRTLHTTMPYRRGRAISLDHTTQGVPVYGVETTHIERYPSGRLMSRTCYLSDLVTTDTPAPLWSTLAAAAKQTSSPLHAALGTHHEDLPTHAKQGVVGPPPRARWVIKALAGPCAVDIIRTTTHAVASEFEDHFQPTYGCGRWLLGRMQCWATACRAERALMKPQNLLQAVRQRTAETLKCTPPNTMLVSVGHEVSVSALAAASFRRDFMFQVAPPEAQALTAAKRTKLKISLMHFDDALTNGCGSCMDAARGVPLRPANHSRPAQQPERLPGGPVAPIPPPTPPLLAGSPSYTLTWVDATRNFDERGSWENTMLRVKAPLCA